MKFIVFGILLLMSSTPSLAEGKKCKKGRTYYSCAETENAIRSGFCSKKADIAEEEITRVCLKKKLSKKKSTKKVSKKPKVEGKKVEGKKVEGKKVEGKKVEGKKVEADK